MQDRGSKPSSRHLGWIGLAAALAVGCGGAESGGGAQSPAGAGAPDQVAAGAKLYGEKCAECHGAHGEGQPGPALVGKAALPLDPPAGAKFRKVQFHTAADVFKFVKATMPPKAPGTLSDADYGAILAFDLKANGVAVDGKTVDASTAATFVLH